jgi:hypothetical protein
MPASLHIAEGEYLSRAQAARFLGIAPGSVDTARRRGSLVPAVEGPPALYALADLERFRDWRDEWLASIGRRVPEPVT